MNQAKTGCASCYYYLNGYCTYGNICSGVTCMKPDASGHLVTLPVDAPLVSAIEPQLATRCLICGKEVLIHKFEEGPKICDECKEAIEWAKRQLSFAKHPTATDSTFDTDDTSIPAKDTFYKEFKVGDRVVVRLESGDYKGTVHNVSDYRPPEEKYAVDLDEYKEDYVFVGSDMLEGLKDDAN